MAFAVLEGQVEVFLQVDGRMIEAKLTIVPICEIEFSLLSLLVTCKQRDDDALMQRRSVTSALLRHLLPAHEHPDLLGFSQQITLLRNCLRG